MIGMRAAALLCERQVMINYLAIKTKSEDWHGVMDAAADLREIDAELRGLTAGRADRSADDHS